MPKHSSRFAPAPPTLTTAVFENMPERDYIDTETHRIPPEHTLVGRTFWRGATYLVFQYDGSATRDLCKCNIKHMHPTVKRMTELELERLGKVLEAVLVLGGSIGALPVKITVAGRQVYRPLYSHPNHAVRYPLLGMDSRAGKPGTHQRAQIVAYLVSQGFTEHTTPDELVGIMESVLETETYMLHCWDNAIQSWTNGPEIIIGD